MVDEAQHIRQVKPFQFDMYRIGQLSRFPNDCPAYDERQEMIIVHKRPLRYELGVDGAARKYEAGISLEVADCRKTEAFGPCAGRR